LRFYTPEGLATTDPADYDYRDQLERMKAVNEGLGTAATSIFNQNSNQSTVDLYKTNAPELLDTPELVDETQPAETENPDIKITE
jgi:lipoteichoic acid synthase